MTIETNHTCNAENQNDLSDSAHDTLSEINDLLVDLEPEEQMAVLTGLLAEAARLNEMNVDQACEWIRVAWQEMLSVPN